jgi:glucose dehydrogenase
VTPQGYSPLGGITQRNVGQLAGAWLDHLEGGATDKAGSSAR